MSNEPGVFSTLFALRRWPWLATARVLRQRFREDRLGLTAGSLTFTTLIALVPLLTVMLAVFSAFPMFASFQGSLEQYFLQTLVPPTIARPVLRALTSFAGQANRLGSAGLLLLAFTALAMMLTIDRTLNTIWRVRKPRPIAQRVLVYWTALTLGPLVIGISLSGTSYALSASRGYVGVMPDTVAWVLRSAEFLLLMTAIAGLFHYVPNTLVRWRHAWAGALFVAIAIELAKNGLAWYVQRVPTFSVLYGAFATVPLLLLWIYLGWVIVLLGAVIAAYAPALQMRVAYDPATPGHQFERALALLRALLRVRAAGAHGLSVPALAQHLHGDPLALEPLVDLLVELDWAGRLDEAGSPRLVLLCDPARTPAAPLLDALLLAPSETTERFRRQAKLHALTLADLIGDPA